MRELSTYESSSTYPLKLYQRPWSAQYVLRQYVGVLLAGPMLPLVLLKTARRIVGRQQRQLLKTRRLMLDLDLLVLNS